MGVRPEGNPLGVEIESGGDPDKWPVCSSGLSDRLLLRFGLGPCRWRDGHMFVAADAVLDGFGIFPGMDEGLPRINVKPCSSGRQSALVFPGS